jgi:amino acid permease
MKLLNGNEKGLEKINFFPRKEFWLAVATLVSFTVGAGILGLPYIFSKAGFLTGATNVIFLGLVVIVLNLMIGEITLRTKTVHQLPGYAGKYLGIKGKRIMISFLLLEWYFAIMAYIIEIGKLSSEVLKPFIDINPLIFSIVIALIGGYLIYKGLLIIEKSEFWIVLITIFLVFFVGILALPKIEPTNLSSFSLKDFWLPFGVVLFAFGGSGAMPEIREELKKKASLMKKVIITGTLISLVLYILFPLFVVGVTGQQTTEEGVMGLGTVFGYKVVLIGGLFGIFTMFTSFLAIGLALKEIFRFDCYNSNKRSTILGLLFPFLASIIIILLKIDQVFYKIIDISGSILFPLTGILFIWIYWKSHVKCDRKPEYVVPFNKTLGIIIILIFLIGLINKIINLLS